MKQLALNWPSSLQDQDQQMQAIQKAFSDIQSTANANATEPLVLVFLPSSTLTSAQSTTSGSYIPIPGFSWTINSQGGLDVINAVISGTMTPGDSARVRLSIDGKPAIILGILGNGYFVLPFHWASVLGQGQHVISFEYLANAGTIAINASGTQSSLSILEYPTNVQNLNVSAA